MRVLVIAVGLPFGPVSTTVWLVKKGVVGPRFSLAMSVRSWSAMIEASSAVPMLR